MQPQVVRLIVELSFLLREMYGILLLRNPHIQQYLWQKIFQAEEMPE
jgi:hypothetical protein